jgi:hypothetical protein
MVGLDVPKLRTTFNTALSGYRGSVIIGATRLIDRAAMAAGQTVVLVGITEAVSQIARSAPEAVIVGISPLLSDLRYAEGFGLVVFDEENLRTPAYTKPYVTIVHPGLDLCLLLQYSVDRPAQSWTVESRTALRYMEMLREEAPQFSSAHIVYGGGDNTEREVLSVLGLPHSPENPRLVFLVSDSGRTATKYAQDRDFCSFHRENIVVCTSANLATALRDHGIVT